MRVRATAAAAAVAMALAATAAAIPASAARAHAVRATAASWQTVLTVTGSGSPIFTAVTATGRHHAWAFQGFAAATTPPTAWQLTRAGWHQVAFPGKASQTVVAAGASSARNAWAFADKGARSQAFRWNGTSWTKKRSFTRSIGGTVVLSRHDVWVFGEPFAPGSGLGARHYNGHRWRRVRSGHGLTAGSALSARSIWAVGGKKVAHWNGHRWSRTSVASILPPNSQFCHPSVTDIYARSARSVWAVGAGNCQDERGPLLLLHFNGRHWRLVQNRPSFGAPTGVAPDGNSRLWIPSVAGFPGTYRVLHYAGGHLRTTTMPVSRNRLAVLAIAAVPQRRTEFAVGATFKASMPGTDQAAVVFEFRR
jgi:hypothetical protein